MLIYFTLIFMFISISMIGYIIIQKKMKDYDFSEFLFFGYRIAGAPLFLTITNYYLILEFNLSVYFNFMAIVFFSPAIFLTIIQKFEEIKTDQLVKEIEKKFLPLINNFLTREGLLEERISFRINQGKAQSPVQIIVTMPEKKPYFEDERLELQQIIQAEYTSISIQLIFDYKFSPKKKSELLYSL
ncbi:hypothetical protein BK120_14895 [Paenibacillus sp. FSL A5-0031]|uniref:hypothetical protein n=1 Tax=Paenibacillus sp. FSL A5-0031 TaxID=1920420 RepID=UPI00096CAB9D|nr:hypothetical protein [Paenibacillus sp. FSL A5-0031]OME83087.1 hypothetical protein BK120_14895 [Paenibacillus sp. FSL A5-0031]